MNFLKNLFSSFAQTLSNEGRDMARITPVNYDGTLQYQLFSEAGLVGAYSRRRDAVRGASRRGLTVA